MVMGRRRRPRHGQRLTEVHLQLKGEIKMTDIVELLKEEGNLAYEKGNFVTAIEVYQQGLRLAPHNFQLCNNVAQAYLRTGQYHEAESFAVKAFTIKKDNVKAYYKAAKAAQGYGDIDKALFFVKRGLRVCPNDANLLTLKDELSDLKTSKMSQEVKPEKKDVVEIVEGVESASSSRSSSVSRHSPHRSKENKKKRKRPVDFEDFKNDTIFQTLKTLNNDPNNISKDSPRYLVMLNKEKLLVLTREGSELLQTGLARKAVEKYKEACSILNNVDVEMYGWKQIDYVILQYALCIGLIQTSNYDDITSAIQLLFKIKDSHASRLPAVYYALGSAYHKLNRYKAALEHINTGLELLEKEILFEAQPWPGTNNIIKETTRSLLEESLKSLHRFCTQYHKPDAVCKYEKCLSVSVHIIPSELIFYSDPDFCGFLVVKCQQKCRIEFHITCWKNFKEKFSSVEKLSDRDLLGKQCPTSDCRTPNNLPSVIVRIEIFGQDAELKSYCEKDIQENVQSAKESRKSKKKKERSLSTSEKQHKTKTRRERKLSEPPSEKLLAVPCNDESSSEEELNSRIKKLEFMRQRNFGNSIDEVWDPREEYFGRGSITSIQKFIVEEFDEDTADIKAKKDFLYSYFEELLKDEGPITIEYMIKKWQIVHNQFEGMNTFIPQYDGIFKFLVVLYKFAALEDTFCLSSQLREVYECTKVDLVDGVQFTLIDASENHYTENNTSQIGDNIGEIDLQLNNVRTIEIDVASEDTAGGFSLYDTVADQCEHQRYVEDDKSVSSLVTTVGEESVSTTSGDDSIKTVVENLSVAVTSTESVPNLSKTYTAVSENMTCGTQILDIVTKIEEIDELPGIGVESTFPPFFPKFFTQDEIVSAVDDFGDSETQLPPPAEFDDNSVLHEAEQVAAKQEAFDFQSLFPVGERNEVVDSVTFSAITYNGLQDEKTHSDGMNIFNEQSGLYKLVEFSSAPSNTKASELNTIDLKMDLHNFEHSSKHTNNVDAENGNWKLLESSVDQKSIITSDETTQTEEQYEIKILSETFETVLKRLKQTASDNEAKQLENIRRLKEQIDDLRDKCEEKENKSRQLLDMLKESEEKTKLQEEAFNTKQNELIKLRAEIVQKDATMELIKKKFSVELSKFNDAFKIAGKTKEQLIKTTKQMLDVRKECAANKLDKNEEKSLETINLLEILKVLTVETSDEKYCLESLKTLDQCLQTIDENKRKLEVWYIIKCKQLHDGDLSDFSLPELTAVPDVNFIFSTAIEKLTRLLRDVRSNKNMTTISKSDQSVQVTGSAANNTELVDYKSNSFYYNVPSQPNYLTTFEGQYISHRNLLPTALMGVNSEPNFFNHSANVGNAGILNPTSGLELSAFKVKDTVNIPQSSINQTHTSITATNSLKNLRFMSSSENNLNVFPKSVSQLETIPKQVQAGNQWVENVNGVISSVDDEKKSGYSNITGLTPIEPKKALSQQLEMKSAVPKVVAVSQQQQKSDMTRNGWHERLMYKLRIKNPTKKLEELENALQTVRVKKGHLSGTLMSEICKLVEKELELLSKKNGAGTMGIDKFSGAAWAGLTKNVTWSKPYDDSEDDCTICMEHMSENTTTLQCKHSFHTECVRNWFKMQRVCPLCKVFTTLKEEFPPLS